MRSRSKIAGAGDVILKIYPATADLEAVGIRLGLISEKGWRKVFLSPLSREILSLGEKQYATVWPKGIALDPTTQNLPWVDAGKLLAGLHRFVVHPRVCDSSLPVSGALDRLKRALRRLGSVPVSERDTNWQLISAASKSLDMRELVDNPQHWIHGDWHLGQMVNIGTRENPTWRLIDIDDVGLGNGTWDLARAAAFFAAGILDSVSWMQFLTSYQAAGGPALEGHKDPWTVLERPARALLIQCAANAWTKAAEEQRSLSEDEQRLLEACSRIIIMKQSELSIQSALA